MRAASLLAMAVVAIALVGTTMGAVKNGFENLGEAQWKPGGGMERKQREAEIEMDYAEEAIKRAEGLLDSLLREPPTSAVVLLTEAKEHLERARRAFAEGQYGEAYGLANSAKKLAQNAIKKLEGLPVKNETPAENELETPIKSPEYTPPLTEPPKYTPPRYVLFMPVIPGEKPSPVTIWYMLASEVQVDPWIHTYIVNTSGENLYNVSFKQSIPDFLQIVDSGWTQVLRYRESRVEGVDRYTYSIEVTYPYHFFTVKGELVTLRAAISGGTVTITYEYSDGTYSYSTPLKTTYSCSYTQTWMGPLETITYQSGCSITDVNGTGREGTSNTTYTYTFEFEQFGDNVRERRSYEYTRFNNYLQRSYGIKHVWGGTGISVDYLGPMDAIYAVIRVAPRGEIDHQKVYGVVTRVEAIGENGENFAVTDSATWQEPFSTFKAIGAPYVGTTTLDWYRFQKLLCMYRYPVMDGYFADEQVEFLVSVDNLLLPDNKMADNLATDNLTDNTGALQTDSTTTDGAGTLQDTTSGTTENGTVVDTTNTGTADTTAATSDNSSTATSSATTSNDASTTNETATTTPDTATSNTSDSGRTAGDTVDSSTVEGGSQTRKGRGRSK